MVQAEKLVVTLTGGAPWGFRLSGGGSLPLVINQIRKRSLAHRQGLKEGDAVITINGTRVHDKTQDEALELVDAAKKFLALEILRGDVDEIGRSKAKKPIKVPHDVVVTAQTTDEVNVKVEAETVETPSFTITASVDDVTSDTFHTPPDTAVVEEGGFTLTATVDDISGSTYSNEQEVSGGGFTLTSSVDEITSSTTQAVSSSPVLVVGDMSTSIHSAEVEAISAAASSPTLMAEPYYESSNVVVEDPTRLSPNPPRSRSRSSKKSSSSPKDKHAIITSPVQNGGVRIPSNGPKSPINHSPKPQAPSPSTQPQVYSPKPQVPSPITQSQAYSPQPQPQVYSPQPQPQPQAYSPQPQPQVYSPQPQPQAYSPKPQTQAQSPKFQPQVYSPKNQPQVYSPQPQPQAVYSPKPQVFSPQPQITSPKPQNFSPQPPAARSPLQPKSVTVNSQAFTQNPATQPVAPKPMVVPTPVHTRVVGGDSSGLTTTTSSSSTFDNGTTRREVTQQVQRLDNGRGGGTIIRRETTTTTTTNKTATPFSIAPAPPSVQTNKGISKIVTTSSSAFQPVTNGINPQQQPPNSYTSSSTLRVSTDFGPQYQPQSNISMSRSMGDLSPSRTPMFKPSRFVPGGGKRDIPGLYAPGSPMVNSEGDIVFGKENVAPQFEVKNIVSDQSRNRSRDVWRPNMWMDSHQAPAPVSPNTVMSGKETPTLRDDFSPYNTFPLPKRRQGYSLVQEQKKRLEGGKPSRTDSYDLDYYEVSSQLTYPDDEPHRHSRPQKLHVFAPPVEIHADGVYDSPTSPYITFTASGEPIYMYDEYEVGPLSPGRTIRKNLYNDSAFYDTPGRNYPTIKEQMQLCKRIAQSLTSAANRRARGAKMFMRRKRKSGKWVHEGHSEWSSSAGDVANIRELESELSPDEGGSKPLLYFKIPNLKNRVGASKAKSTKMSLTQEQFERLRLESKKCEHTAVKPDTCFGIVADLKAHKGKGGRMFERRRERTDRYVIDENNARGGQGANRRLEQVLSQPVKQSKSPWEAAIEHGGNVDAAFSHLSEWERNQKMNAMLQQASGPRKIPLVSTVQTAPLPSIPSASLKGDGSSFLLRGKDFNRVARGWQGGGEYPAAERLHHVSPTRQTGATGSSSNYNNKIKAWQNPGQSPYAPVAAPPVLPEPTREDQWTSSIKHDVWQPSSRVEYRPSSAPHHPNPVRPVSWMSESYHSGAVDEDDYTYAPVDFRYAPDSYPTVAYMQPIIPGTDC